MTLGIRCRREKGDGEIAMCIDFMVPVDLKKKKKLIIVRKKFKEKRLIA